MLTAEGLCWIRMSMDQIKNKNSISKQLTLSKLHLFIILLNFFWFLLFSWILTAVQIRSCHANAPSRYSRQHSPSSVTATSMYEVMCASSRTSSRSRTHARSWGSGRRRRRSTSAGICCRYLKGWKLLFCAYQYQITTTVLFDPKCQFSGKPPCLHRLWH